MAKDFRRETPRTKNKPLSPLLSPWQIPVAGFLGLIFLGAFLLCAFPTPGGGHLSFIDALFMSTSATCVTGLSLIDIGTQLSGWGQLVLLAEIQLGGLGIMIISTVLLMMLGRGLSLRSRMLVQDTYTYGPTAQLHRVIKAVVLSTLVFETLGALLLFIRFSSQMNFQAAAVSSLFHAISAFCNAGFGLFADSLIGYQADPLVNLTITGLIICGGIGFLVLYELANLRFHPGSLRHSWQHLSLHSKLVLTVTAVLLAGGTLFFLGSEWNCTLQGLNPPTKVLAAWFQSVTTRTAGFNTLDFSAMNNISLLGTIMLMFIGASPGSTGGGIKTSTVGVLLALSRARISGTLYPHAFKRTIDQETIDRAFSVLALSMAIVMVATALLLWSELGSVPQAQSRGRFLELLFEVVSAFGTVGLSMGATPRLTDWGKLILVVVMFIGRLGPLVLAMAIQAREKRGRFQYAHERVMIG